MIRIGVIGPESTGKSTLCKLLSERFGYRWVKEYAREYVEALQRPYTYSDLDAICRRLTEQLRTEYKEQVVLFDTELIIMKVWYAHVYGCVPAGIEQTMRTCPMNAYLLLAPDLPAEHDAVRENLDKRDYFFAWYEREIQATGVPYAVIRGTGDDRIQSAIEAMARLITK